jgi:hypothetical protein
MSNIYDNEIFDRSVEGSSEFQIPIKSVQRYEIQDSNNLNYSSGQVRFNLNQLATSASYIDWKKSHLILPITLNTTSAAGNGILGTNQVAHYYATLKNSFTSLIDSLVLSINNVEVVSKTGSLLNIPLHFNLMTSWDQNDVNALGSSVGFYPDDSSSLRWDATRGELNNAMAVTLSNPLTAAGGLSNAGRVYRHYKTVTSLFDAVTSFYDDARMRTSHKSFCDAAGNTNSINCFIECVIPLRYLHGVFGQLPLMRGASVQLLVNTHLPSTASFTTTATGAAMDTAAAKSVFTPNGFLPFMVSDPAAAINAAVAQSISFKASVGNPFNSSCQLRLSLCELNPEYESRLVKSPMKPIVYRDWYCFPNQSGPLTSGSAYNQQLNINISKLRRLLIIPKIAVNGTITEFADAYQSPFTSAGCTTTPALITNLQVYLSGKPMYQSPLQYSYDQFLIELDGINSVNGGIDDGLRAGLIDKNAFEGAYGYICVNLGRKDSADDTLEKSIQISFSNNNKVTMSYSFFIEYERQFELDVVSGKIVV